MNVRVSPVTATSRSDFWRVHDESEGCGWCYCVAWHVPTWNGWGERSDAENRALRQELFERGEYDGYVLYVDDEPAGWCQVGARDRLPKLVGSYALLPDPAVWAITCFALRPRFRGRGLARRLLAEILGDLARRGIRHVQSFPREGKAWCGPEALYRDAGFVRESERPAGPVLGKELASNGDAVRQAALEPQDGAE